MSSHSQTNSNLLLQRVMEHLKTPLYQNAYALTLSSLATSGIGLVYWVIAAHRYSVNIVGINSAVISAMMFLAGAAELNLMSAIIRFIPTARDSTRHFVIYSYLVSVLVAAVISFIFVLKLPAWSPALQFLGIDPSLAFWFILSTMMWCIFVLQDSVLTGLRQATWVPVENTVFSLAKIGLMIAFARTFPSLGLFASWSFALVIAVVPTNFYIFRKLIPIHEMDNDQSKVPIKPRQVIRFVAVDYVGALFWLVCTTLMPVIVTTVTGSESNAYFYLSWTIANSLYLFSSSMGQSLVVEAAKNQQKLGSYSHRAFKNIARIVILAAGVLILTAPVLLRIYGKGYSTQGTTLLRLLALSSVPFIINAIFVSVARVQYRMKAVVATLGSLCTLTLGLSFIFLRLIGIVGVGIGWLVSQTIVGIIVYLTQLRPLWANSAKEIQTQGVFEVVQFNILEWLYRMGARTGLNSVVSIYKNKWIGHQNQILLNRLIPEVVKALPNDISSPSRDHWAIQRIVHTVTDTTVAFLCSTDHDSEVVLKLQPTEKSVASQNKNRETLLRLTNSENLGAWRQLLPVIIAEGSVDSQNFSVERVLPGIPMAEKLKDAQPHWDYIQLATDEISHLHQRTAHTILVDQGDLDRWIDQPLTRIYSLYNAGLLDHLPQSAIDRLQTELHSALDGKRICASWIHGDYCPANILVSPTSNWITGIVDWDLAEPNDIPMLDLVHLMISVRMDIQQREMGSVVSNLLIDAGWTPEEQVLLSSAQHLLPGSELDPRTLLILCWLRHVNANLTKSSRFEHHRYWISENIESVIRVL